MKARPVEGDAVSFKAKPGNYFTVKQVTQNGLIVLNGQEGAYHHSLFDIHDSIPVRSN